MAPSSYNCSLATALLLILSVIITSSDQQCDSDDDGCRMYQLHGLFEEALISSNGSLWQLQQYYFNPFSYQNSVTRQVNISIWVTANSIRINDSYQCGSGYYGDSRNAFIYCSEHNTHDSHCKNGQWLFFSYYILQPPSNGPSNLTRLMTTWSTTQTMFAFDPTFYSIMIALSSSTEAELYYYRDTDPDTINLKLHINTTLQENPCIYDAVTALGTIFAWAKSYARSNGIPDEKQDTDRSIVTGQFVCDSMDGCDTSQSSSIDYIDNIIILLFSLLLSIFTLSNLLLVSLTLLTLRKIFLWLQGQDKWIKILYKASAIVLTCINIITLISDVAFIINGSKYFIIDLSFVLPTKVPLVLLILVFELPLVCSNTHLLNDANQPNTRCQRFAHAFALCHIVWFMHRIVNDAIISVMYFILAPAQTLGIDALLLTIIASAIAFVAIIIHKWSNSDGCNKQLFSFAFCTALNGLMICGLLIAITWMFITLIRYGLKSAGMGGLILALIPPLAVTVIGYIIKDKYFKSVPSSESENQLQEMNRTTTIQNVDDAEQDVQLQEARPLLHSQR